MKNFRFQITLKCDTVTQADSTADALRNCLAGAQDAGQIAEFNLEYQEEIHGRINANVRRRSDEKRDLPAGLSYDEIFVPDPEAL